MAYLLLSFNDSSSKIYFGGTELLISLDFCFFSIRLEDILDFNLALNFSTALESLDKFSVSAGRVSMFTDSVRGVEKADSMSAETSIESL